MNTELLTREEEMESIRRDIAVNGRLEDYPLKASRMKGCRVLLALLGTEITFEELFTGSFRRILQQCCGRFDDVLRMNMRTPTQAHCDSYRAGFEALITVLPSETSLQDLMVADKTQWPVGVEAASRELWELGMFLPYYLLPDSERHRVASFLDESGDDFIGLLGFTRIADYVTFPREPFTEDELDLFRRSRRLGITLRHKDTPLPQNEKAPFIVAIAGGYCWDGNDCIESSNKDCIGGPGPGTDIC